MLFECVTSRVFTHGTLVEWSTPDYHEAIPCHWSQRGASFELWLRLPCCSHPLLSLDSLVVKRARPCLLSHVVNMLYLVGLTRRYKRTSMRTLAISRTVKHHRGDIHCISFPSPSSSCPQRRRRSTRPNLLLCRRYVSLLALIHVELTCGALAFP